MAEVAGPARLTGHGWHDRLGSTFRFVRVSWDGRSELGEVDGITGGTVKLSLGDTTRSSLSLDCERVPEIGSDMLRVYADHEFSDGSTATTCLGTYLLDVDDVTLASSRRSGTARGYSRLRALKTRLLHEPLSMPGGTGVVAWVRATLLDALGMPCEVQESAYVSSGAHAWDAGKTCLEVANDALAMAGFGSLDVDGYGVVQLAPYVSPYDATPSVEMADGEHGCFEEGARLERSRFDVPNVVVVRHDDDELSVYGEAALEDSDPLSVASRHYEVTRVEDLHDVGEGATEEQAREACQAKAQELLRSSRPSVERATVTHYYVGLRPGDPVAFRYRGAGYSQVMGVWSTSIDLGPAMRCTTVLRRFDVS